MQRRTFLGSLIALATLGKLPKAKAPKTIPLKGSGVIGFDIHKALEEKYEQAFIDRAHWMADVTERVRIDEKTLRSMRKAMKLTRFKCPDDMTPGELMDLDRQNERTRAAADRLWYLSLRRRDQRLLRRCCAENPHLSDGYRARLMAMFGSC